MLETHHHHHQQQQKQRQRQQRVITSPFSSSTCMDKSSSSSKPFELQPQPQTTTFDSSTMTTTTTTTTCNEHNNNSIGTTTTTNSNSNQKVVTISAAQVSPQIHPQSSNLSTISTGSSNQTLMTSHLRRPTTTSTNTTTQPRSLIPTSKRKASIPVKRPLHSITEAVNSTTPTHQQQRNKRSRQIAEEQSPDNHKITTATTPRKTPTNHNNITSPVPNTSSTKELMKSPPASSTTARITRFFTSASKKQANHKSSNNNNNNNSEEETKSVTPSPSPSASNNLDGSEEVRKELERVRAQVAALEKKLDAKDKELEDRSSQLKAVNSSRTIYQGQLQKALQEREKQIEELKTAYDTLQNKSQTVIEKLVRREATREAKELRQTLASDGARLGRLVYSRGGYMQALESWEDGEESKSIKRTRQQLKEQRESLELKRQQLNSLNGSAVDTLGVLEAVKSLERKIRSVQKEELMYMKKDQDLALEKGAHIRSLKRVSSEDSSRFVSRPKLKDRYVLLSQLGRGGFSEVWRAFDLVDLKEVAVKIHQLDERWSEGKKANYTKHVSREYEIHRLVRHPRIVSLFDVFEIDDNSFATVLECCNGTDLDTILKDKRHMSEEDAYAVLLQVLSGMRYLSSPSKDGERNGIIHYDLKPGNILLDEHGDAKITDFGLSKIVDAETAEDSMELTSQGAGTYWYLPPECFVIDQNVRISNKVDVWSIGVIYYQMLFGKRPFGDGQSQEKVLSNHVMLNAREVKFPEKSKVSDGAKHFIKQCLTYDQAFRPTMSQLCALPYVQMKHL